MMVPSRAAAREIPRLSLGDVANPTAASSTLDCGLFAGGVFKKACWCLDWPDLCSTENYQAAVALAYPSTVYAPIKAPPVVGAPTGPALTVPPASGEQAQATVDAIIAQQQAEWQAQNQATMGQTAANLEQVAANKPSILPSSPTAYLILGAVAVGVLVLFSKRG